jgi:hypothetical protein
MTHRTIESALTVFRNRGKEVPWLMATKTSDEMRRIAKEARDRGQPCFL